MANEFQVIEIDSSDDEQPESKHQPTVESPEPEITGQRITLPTPDQILEARRKRIDDMFTEYARNHNLLLNLEHLMNPEQHLRWRNHLNSRSKPIPVEPSQLTGLPSMRDTYMSDTSPSRLIETPSPFSHPYGSSGMSRASYPRRRAIRKKKAPKRRTATRRTTVKKRPAFSQTATSRYQTTGGPSGRSQTSRVTVKSESSRPSTSAGPRAFVKSEKVSLKRERA